MLAAQPVYPDNSNPNNTTARPYTSPNMYNCYSVPGTLGTTFTMQSLTCSVAGNPCAVVPSPGSELCFLLVAPRQLPASAVCGPLEQSVTLVPDRFLLWPCCNHPNQSTCSVDINVFIKIQICKYLPLYIYCSSLIHRLPQTSYIIYIDHLLAIQIH